MKALLLYLIIRIYRLFCFFKIKPKARNHPMDSYKTPVIYAFWHNSILLLSFARDKKRRIKILISTHRDGKLASDVIEYFNLGTVGGSSHRNPQKAFREMIKALQDGYDIGITPDGPKGPAQKVKRGIIELAYLTKAPIVPVVLSVSSAWYLNSWDRFIIPKPFSRVEYSFLDPIYIKNKNEIDEKSKELENVLNSAYIK